MPRAIWTGTIGFGLVNVPVKLYSAVVPKTVKFKQINGETGGLVKQKRVDAGTGDEVAFDSIVKGYELAPDRYVIIEPEELENVAPKQTRQVVIDEFVPAAEIDPILFDKTYYLGPGEGGDAGYRLLATAMDKDDRVGIGTIIVRSKEQMCAIRSKDGVLHCSLLVWADEITDPTDLVTAPGEVDDRQLNMARALINSLAVPFDHTAHKDTYREKVLGMIEAKAAGTEWTPEEDTPAPAVPDLMAALEASLAATEGGARLNVENGAGMADKVTA